MHGPLVPTLQALSIPDVIPEEVLAASAAAAAAAAAAAGGKGAKAPARASARASAKPGGKDAAQPEVELSLLPGNPLPLLTPDLAKRLNPLVLQPFRANRLPDMPATKSLLEEKCEPVRLRLCWPPKSLPREQLGRPGQWVEVEARDSGGPGLHTRCVGFGHPDVMLAGDYPVGG